MTFFIPGKTFLVGEYAVLLDGPALGLATRPYFEFTLLDANEESGQELINFHSQSPAGLYLNENKKSVKASFKDGYSDQGALGGFGKSTAEYFAAITPDLLKQKKSFFDIHKEYKNLHQHLSLKPSGIDLAFQFFGNVTLADPALQFYQTFDWNFSELDFFLVSTGIKVPTHEHLANLNLSELKELPVLSNQVVKSYSENNESEFIYQLKNWCEMLEAHSLTHLHSLHIKLALEKNPEIILVKPCGALGADVLLVLFKRENSQSVYNHLLENNLNVQAGADDLANGLFSQLNQYWSENVD